MSIALILAVLSSIAIRPSLEELAEYVDWRSLGILLSLMLSVAGFKMLGIFQKAASFLLKYVSDTRKLVTILVMLCFFLSMAFTNDVALITFVPFALFILDSVNHRELMIKTVALQTIAANMGSMLTPIGNPQNLYIFSFYDFTLTEFLKTMGPYTLIAFISITALLFTVRKERLTLDISVSSDSSDAFGLIFKIKPFSKFDENTKYIVKLITFSAIFLLALLAVGRIIDWYYVLLAAVIFVLLLECIVLSKVDYALLFTFMFLFVFIGNLGSVHEVSSWLLDAISGKEILIGALSSQFLSNVPATLLLSGFTDNGADLLIGVNIGGLGTIIASMASLISYKFVSAQYYEYTGKYLLWFSAVNFALLAILLVFSYTAW